MEEDMQTHQFLCEGMHCVSCVRHIEDLLHEHRVSDVSVGLFSGTISFRHDKSVDLKPILDELQAAGYKVVQPEKQSSPGESSSHPHAISPRPLPIRWLEDILPSKRHQRKRHRQVCEACRAETTGALPTRSQTRPAVGHATDERWSRSTFSVEGMTCSSCVSSLKSGLHDDAIRHAEIILMPGRAVIEHNTAKLSIEDIKTIIEDLGYDASLDSTASLDKEPESVRWHAKLSVGGMTCASCSGAVKQSLSRLQGATDINVELMAGLASLIVLDEKDITLAKHEIEDAGFEADIVEVKAVDDGGKPHIDTSYARMVRMRVDGMFCHECVGKVNAALEQLTIENTQLSISPVTLKAPYTIIAYMPQASGITLRTIRQRIWELGFGFVSAPLATIEQRAAKARARERKYIFVRLLIAFIFAIPTFIIAVVGMSLLPTSNGFRRSLETPAWGMASRGELALWGLATPVQFGVGAFFYTRSWKSLRAVWRKRRSNTSWQSLLYQRLFRWGSMDTLVALGTSLAYFSSVAFLALDVNSNQSDSTGMGYFDSSVFLIFFIIGGRYLEAASKQRTGDAITELKRTKATTGQLYTPGTDEKVSATEEMEATFFELGDLIIIPAGSSPPLDGVLVDASSLTAFDESTLTGEARPVLKRHGDAVYAGTINRGPAAALIKVTCFAGESMVDNIASAVRDAMSKKASIERIADTITAYFVPAIVAIACFTFAIWLLRGYTGNLPYYWLDGQEQGGWALFAIQFAIAVLVVACPCGIGLAAPTAQLVGVGLAAKNGILPNGGGEAFQAFSRINTLVIDKTGTLTTSEFQVSDAMFSLDEEADRALIWSVLSVVEATSSHPLSVGLRKRCESETSKIITQTELLSTEEIPGRGLAASVVVGKDGDRYEVLIGNESLMQERGANYDTSSHGAQMSGQVELWQAEAKSVIMLALRHADERPSLLPQIEDKFQIVAQFGLHDPPRPEARTVIAEFRKHGITTWMCTGDNEATARAVAASVGIDIDHVMAHALPEDKKSLIQRLQAASVKKRVYVAFCGDGINDSPALAQADAGIAMGSGSAVALKAAHFSLIGSSLLGLVTLRSLSRSTTWKIYSNFAWAAAFNFCLIPLAAGAFYQLGQTRLPPVWASLAMALSSVSVVTNSLLLRVMFRLPRIVRDWRASV